MAKTPSLHSTQSGRKANVIRLADRNKAYRFQEQDPAMIELCSLIDQSQLPIKEICKKVSIATGGAYNVGEATIYNWLNGKTKRPQNYTMTWVGFALGVERRWTQI